MEETKKIVVADEKATIDGEQLISSTLYAVASEEIQEQIIQELAIPDPSGLSCDCGCCNCTE